MLLGLARAKLRSELKPRPGLKVKRKRKRRWWW
jgi:hypothetical protein